MMLENDRNANIFYAFHKYNKTTDQSSIHV